MLYDCLIVGGGLAGLTCGIRCVSAGLKTAIISGGMNSLHFSSGSIDLAGYDDKGAVIKKPFEYISSVPGNKKTHPYGKTGITTIKKSIEFFTEEIKKDSLILNNNGNYNHFRVSALGMLKPSYMSQESIFSERAAALLNSKSIIAVLNFMGFRDYYPQQTLAILKKSPVFKNVEITSGEISLPYYYKTEKNIHEFRSIDLARIFETEKFLPRIAEEIKKVSGNADAVSLPAFLGIKNYAHIRQKLEEMTGKYIYEIPTLPPSIPGLRIDNALKNRFIALGGDYISGDRVESGIITKGILEKIITRSSGSGGVKAGFYVLSTGSFFSGGIASEFGQIFEPVFRIRTSTHGHDTKWYSPSFFSKEGHPFLSYGVETDEKLNPSDSSGRRIRNLFCAGSVLSGYDPVKEGNGGGVAISTGFCCAERIIRGINK